MAETAEQEWQPARLRLTGHPTNSSPLTSDERTAALKKIVRVCEWQPSDDLLVSFRIAGCDAEKFFRIHPDDLADRLAYKVIVQCEHGILTD